MSMVGAPGGSIALRVGEDVTAAHWGFADLDEGRAMDADTPHDIASVSKVLTTVALLRLVDANTLRLDETLGSVLGATGERSAITLRHLLTHRAGLREWWPLYLEPEPDPLRSVLSLPLRYPIDSGRHYSDLGFQLLGAVVTAATGLPFPAAIRTLVLGPLGLSSTSERAEPGRAAASSDGDSIERLMVRDGEPYPVDVDDAGFAWRDRTLRGEANDGNAFHAFGGPAGHAGWFSTVGDLLTLATVLAAPPDDHGLWSAATREAFLGSGPDPEQALGLRRYPAADSMLGRDAWGHPGFTGCAIAFAPAHDDAPMIAAAFASNRLHGRPAPTRAELTSTDILFAQALELVRDPSETETMP